MKRKIFKYQLQVTDRQIIQMPKDAKILSVQSQNEIPCLWAEVAPESETEERIFEVFGTGHEIHYDIGTQRTFIGTFQLSGGSFVGHLFERID